MNLPDADGRPEQPAWTRARHGIQRTDDGDHAEAYGGDAHVRHAPDLDDAGKRHLRMEMNHYDIVPQLVADKILANTNAC